MYKHLLNELEDAHTNLELSVTGLLLYGYHEQKSDVIAACERLLEGAAGLFHTIAWVRGELEADTEPQRETWRQRAQRECPDMTDPDEFGGMMGCPQHLYEEAKPPVYCKTRLTLDDDTMDDRCRRCWDRFTDETEETNNA